jgi:hypothetical protein
MNRWENYVWMAAGAAALTVVGAFTAKPLLAQIKAALVQNVDEPGRIPYQSSAVFAQGSPGCAGPGCFSCTGTFCALSFTQIPSNKRLVVTGVFGKVYVNTPGVLEPIQLLVAGVGPLCLFLPFYRPARFRIPFPAARPTSPRSTRRGPC